MSSLLSSITIIVSRWINVRHIYGLGGIRSVGLRQESVGSVVDSTSVLIRWREEGGVIIQWLDIYGTPSSEILNLKK